MDTSKDRKFLVYLGIGATLGAAYLAINYLSNRKNSKAKPLTLEKTRKILQQIKFQILTTCTTFVQGLKNKPKTNHSQQDLEIFYRSQLAKVYEMREDTILGKYNVSRDQYAVSLNHYKKDIAIQKGQKEIIDILQNATKNIFPDYTVPRQAKTLLREQQVPQVYLEMCELISIKVWQKLDQQKQKNPGFNSKDDAHFKKAIRQISIYDIKSQFLQKKGFRPEWGCPNQVFYKVMESLKQENKEIKNRATVIEKAYEKIIQRITNQPQHLNAQRIKFLFDEIVNNKAPEAKPVPQVQQKPQVPIQNPVQNIPKRVVAPAKKEDDFNMDQLMMQQLMSRSQEEPKQVIKAEPAPKVEQKPQVAEQPKKQPKENLDQVHQLDNLIKQQEVQIIKQQGQEPILEVQKTQEIILQVIQNQAVPVSTNVEEKPKFNEEQPSNVENIIVVQQKAQELQTQVISEVKEQERLQVIADVVDQPQEHNDIVQPQEHNDIVQPQEHNDIVQPQEHNDIVQPQEQNANIANQALPEQEVQQQ